MSFSKKRLLSTSKTKTHTLQTSNNSINNSKVKSNEEINFVFATSHRFDWFHNALQYTPMWVITTPHKTDAKLILRTGCFGAINQFALICLILTLFYITFVWIIYDGRAHEHHTIDYLETLLFDTIYSTWQILFLLNRYLAIFHFSSMACCIICKYCDDNTDIIKQDDINSDITDKQERDCIKQYGFHYSWLEHGIYWNDKLQICKKYYLNQTRKATTLIFAFIIIFTLLGCAHSGVYFYYDYRESDWIEGISDGLSIFVLWIPICFSQICPVLIFLNYQMSLFTLNMYLKRKKQWTSGQVLELYCELYNSFKKKKVNLRAKKK
eukprot:120974_1